MYILQNAFRNVLRNKGRNILLGAIIFIIIVSIVVALMINNTTGSIIDDYKSRFASVVSIIPNIDRMREQAMADGTTGPRRIMAPIIPSEQYVEFGNSGYLYDAVYTASTAVNSAGMTSIDAGLGGQAMQGTLYVNDEALMPTSFYFSLQGNRFDEFAEGLRGLNEGRMPENESECIISSDLAGLNNISVGDTLSLASEISLKGDKSFADTQNAQTHYELEVVGIYFDATDEYMPGGRQNAFTNRRNEILTTYDTVVAPFLPGYSGITISATYFVENPDMIPAFAKELYAKGLDPIFDVTTDEASYNKIIGPVEGLRSISITFMMIVLVFGGVIIALLASMAIRERKYEIGVLRAMGMKKHKVALGLWAEMVIVTGVCLVIGLVVGTLVAQPVTNALLAGQIEAAAAASQMPGYGGGAMMVSSSSMGSAAAGVEPLSEISIALGLGTALQIIGIALLLATFAALIAISRITKYEPIKILMERN